MACVYILYSKALNKYYTGSCFNLEVRLNDHLNKKFIDGYTSKADDWELYFCINNLEYKQARAIEQHIKKMKSRRFIENLKIYPEITEKILKKYKSGLDNDLELK